MDRTTHPTMFIDTAPATWTDQAGVEQRTPQLSPGVRPRFSKYRRLRAYLLLRDRVCVACGTTDRLHIDHVVPRHQGGSHHPDNLQLLCITCHGKKTGAEWRQRVGLTG